MSHPFFQLLVPPYVVGHRGAAGLAPENTLPSFECALACGAHALELDVHLTRDQQVIVTHDARVDRVTNGSGPVASHTLELLQDLDAGYRFTPDRGQTFPWRNQGVVLPTLDTVLTTFPDTPLIIEMKPDSLALAERLAALLHVRKAAHRVLVGSFHDRIMHHFRQCAPTTATAAGKAEAKRWVLRTHSGFPIRTPVPFQALTVPPSRRGIPVITQRVCRTAHAQGLQIQVWTINQPDMMRALYAKGVDGITSDYPDRALAVAREIATTGTAPVDRFSPIFR